MKRNKIVNGYEVYPKTVIAQNALYHNMSNHYRRLYNAKPVVDTSAPKSYKILKEKTAANKYNSYDPLVNGQFNTRKSVLKKNLISANKRNVCDSCQQQKPQDCYNKDFLDSIKAVPFQPRILKTNAESKIRSLKEYHPPRKKILHNVKNQDTLSVMKPTKLFKPDDDNQDFGEYEDDIDWLQPPHHMDIMSTSKPSSSDSAYTEENEGMWSGGESREESPQQMQRVNFSSKIRSDDHRYVEFLRTITDEVLRKGIYTNKSLKSLFKDHINRNKHKLDVKRMEKEVESLQKDLGIPKDDDLNDEDFGLGSGSAIRDIIDQTDIIDSIHELSINQKENTNSKNEEWLSNKRTSWHDITDDMKLPLKLPDSDNGNDSIISGEILTDSSGKNSEEVSSVDYR